MRLFAGLFVVSDHLVDYETQEFLAEFRIEIGRLGQCAQSRNLTFFPVRVGGGQRGFRLVFANGLRDAKPFGQHVDDRGIDVVDAFAITGQRRVLIVRDRCRFLRFLRHCARN